jgi:hypothetical protein
LLELVRLNQKRNNQKVQAFNFFEQEQLFSEFSRVGLEDWMDLYTEEDLTNFFANQVVVLNHNEKHTYDNLVQLTPISSGLHIGSSNWQVEVAQMNFAIFTNMGSLSVKYRHPMPFSPGNGAGSLSNADVMLVSSMVLDTNRPTFDS